MTFNAKYAKQILKPQNHLQHWTQPEKQKKLQCNQNDGENRKNSGGGGVVWVAHFYHKFRFTYS